MSTKIYLGDSAIKKILVDYFKSDLYIQFDYISTFTGETWKPSGGVDYEDGWIKFGKMKYFNITPVMVIPNDYIYSHELNFVENSFYLTCGGEIYDESKGAMVFSDAKIVVKHFSTFEVIDNKIMSMLFSNN
jgi:hypothetical protein